MTWGIGKRCHRDEEDAQLWEKRRQPLSPLERKREGADLDDAPLQIGGRRKKERLRKHIVRCVESWHGKN